MNFLEAIRTGKLITRPSFNGNFIFINARYKKELDILSPSDDSQYQFLADIQTNIKPISIGLDSLLADDWEIRE